MTSDFAGGIRQLNTKDIPESNSWQFSIGATYNNLVTLQQHNYATNYGIDVLGLGQSKRDITMNLPTATDFINSSKTEKLAAAAAMQTTWGLETKSTLPRRSLQIIKTIGKDLGEKEMGLGHRTYVQYFSSIQQSDRYDYDAANELFLLYLMHYTPTMYCGELF